MHLLGSLGNHEASEIFSYKTKHFRVSRHQHSHQASFPMIFSKQTIVMVLFGKASPQTTFQTFSQLSQTLQKAPAQKPQKLAVSRGNQDRQYSVQSGPDRGQVLKPFHNFLFSSGSILMQSCHVQTHRATLKS